MDTPSNPCPNCGQPVETGKPLCPNCGAEVTRVWPPPPEGSEIPTPSPVPPEVARQQVTTGTVSGCGLAIVLLFGGFVSIGSILTKLGWVSLPGNLALLAVLVLPIFALGIIYFLLRGNNKIFFARGIGYAALATAVLALGAYLTCGR